MSAMCMYLFLCNLWIFYLMYGQKDLVNSKKKMTMNSFNDIIQDIYYINYINTVFI